VALERILDEARKLPKAERERLIRELTRDRARDEAGKEFEKAAGSWRDLNAEEFVAEVYRRRARSERPPAEW